MIKAISAGAAVVGFVILIVAVVVGWVVAPNLIENMVEKETQLQNGTDIYEKWVNIPVPIYLKFYLWNVTNYEDYQNNKDWSAKPNISEIGPYIYKENRTKYEIRSNPDDDTVTYRQKITYTFVPEMSVGPDTDVVNIINVPLFSVAAVLATKNLIITPLVLQLLLGPLSRERLVKMDVPVRDVIFGWRLNLIYDIIASVGTELGMHFPPEMQDGKFGFYLNRNNTNADGLWEVYSGVRDSSKFSIIKTIEGESRLDDWWDDECAMINGTDGTMFPPFVEKDTTLFAYIPEICRSVWLRYTEKTEYEGIPGYRFRIPNELFTSPHIHPPNWCFCMPVKPPLNQDCDFTGGGRIFSCKSDAPIIISKPHFLDAQEDIYTQMDGLKPEKAKHDTFIDVEPITGFPLRAQKRLQIGVELQTLSTFGAPWNTINHVFFPAIWADEEAALDDKLVDEIKTKLIKPLRLVTIGKWSAVGVGIFVTVVGSTYFSYLMWFKK
ncbi:platelet glycoprotein 4 [Folsomia candida]|uniref:platelet glycoprotein 4 n=1 Tax=Folsomia candida TaxID=158441 RepID=UPI000B8FF9AB|nr:platelet glycoprotein 4 [Folsomia candida]